MTSYVWVFDIGHLLRGTPSAITSRSQVVVLEHAGRRIGLLVSELHGVATVAPDKVMPAPVIHGANGMLVSELIKANAGRLLIQCIDPTGLMQLLQERTRGKQIDADSNERAAA